MVVMVVIVVAVAMTADIHLDARIVIVGQLGRRTGHGGLLVPLAQVDPSALMTQPTGTTPRTRRGGRGTGGGSGNRGGTIRMAQRRRRRPGGEQSITEHVLNVLKSAARQSDNG